MFVDNCIGRVACGLTSALKRLVQTHIAALEPIIIDESSACRGVNL